LALRRKICGIGWLKVGAPARRYLFLMRLKGLERANPRGQSLGVPQL